MGYSTYDCDRKIDRETLHTAFNAGLFAKQPTLSIAYIDGDLGEPFEAGLLDDSGQLIGRCDRHQIEEIIASKPPGRNPNLPILSFLLREWALLETNADRFAEAEDRSHHFKVLPFIHP